MLLVLRPGIKNTGEISINNKGGKTGFLHIDSKSADDIHSSGNKVGATETFFLPSLGAPTLLLPRLKVRDAYHMSNSLSSCGN